MTEVEFDVLARGSETPYDHLDWRANSTIGDNPAAADIDNLESLETEQHGSEGGDDSSLPDGENAAGDDPFTVLFPLNNEGSHETAATLISVPNLGQQRGNITSEETATSRRTMY